ncbi:hypothetical protein THASP1DRAFT_31756 [Thamnocephalis sphaerospora]|uniref:MATH domain-containing protein n=1 Tax=Thamnocephalis sphaerospora TaxID=78915 RepID=A0A4P9XKT0_9FUNG|nr:hypothetical protein THASP1DRAFT_31756 [Thamnocephalis sphaerospora]|eukprot:RKP06424.1 hypothetical protein THASP1DRAFT_31756 [Thamnocephalis sphaerospora]
MNRRDRYGGEHQDRRGAGPPRPARGDGPDRDRGFGDRRGYREADVRGGAETMQWEVYNFEDLKRANVGHDEFEAMRSSWNIVADAFPDDVWQTSAT